MPSLGALFSGKVGAGVEKHCEIVVVPNLWPMHYTLQA